MSSPVSAWLRKAAASVLFTGYCPVASGTAGSAVAIVLVWVVNRYAPVVFAPESAMLYWLFLVALTAGSLVVCSKALQDFKGEDPRQIVLDEFVGQLIVFFMVPITLRTLGLGFLLFRFFDIVKPFPVHNMEEIEGGVGVVMDDVMAGVCANVCLLLVLVGYHSVHGALV